MLQSEENPVRLVSDEMDGTIYLDVIFNPADMDAMRFGEMIEAQHQTPGFRLLVGARLDGVNLNAEEETP
jgi:hypothetical protein